MHLLHTFLFLMIAILAACGGARTNSRKSVASAENVTKQDTGHAKYTYGSELEVKVPVRVEPGEPAALSYPLPTLGIVTPKAESVSQPGEDILLRLDLRHWDVAPQGKHVHLIIDNEAYIPLFDISEPIPLKALYQTTFNKALAAGPHIIRVFPGHSHHESVKRPQAFASVRFYVDMKPREKQPPWPSTSSVLTYSRPKGCNPAGKPVLLDFFLTRTPVHPKTFSIAKRAVHYRLMQTPESDSETPTLVAEGTINTWQPHWIHNLAVGRYQLTLSLKNEKDEDITGPFNETTRAFTVEAECKKMPVTHAH